MTKVSGTISQLGVSGTIAQLGVSGTISQKGVSGTITESGYSVVGTVPVFVSASVANATPTKVILTYDQALDTGSVPATTDFALAEKTISGVAIVGSTVEVTVTVAYAYGDIIAISYTAGSNPIRGDVGEINAGNLVSQSVTNNIVFIPSSLANLLREYYSDVGVTVTGSGVSQMTDGSVNAAHATQSTDSKRPPLLAAEINGLPAIKGDGSADLLSFTSTGNLTNFSLFIVAKPLVSNEIIAGNSASANHYVQMLANTRIRLAANGALKTFETGTLTGYHIYEIKRNYTGSYTTYCFIDGTQSSTGGVNGTTTVFSIDQLLAFTTTVFGKAALASFVLYSDYKSDPDSLLVCNYLKSKYAIA